MTTEPALLTSRIPTPPVSQSDAIIHMIERAARDPSIDVDKMLKLLDRRDQIVREEADRAWAVAMAQCQAAMRPIIADANNPSTRSKYATYAALDDATRPIYTANGFAPSFDTDPASPPDWLHVFCDLSHIGGRTYRYHFNMPADGKGARGNDVMTKTHAAGSAFTYARRYLLIGMFNLAIDKDDDGNAAGRRENPHTFKADWATDNVPAADDPDRISDMSDVPELKRTLQGPVFQKLQDELAACKTLAEVENWKDLESTRYRAHQLRPEWRDTLRGLTKERLMELRGAAAQAAFEHEQSAAELAQYEGHTDDK